MPSHWVSTAASEWYGHAIFVVEAPCCLLFVSAMGDMAVTPR